VTHTGAIALIPARGGSKRLPGKALLPLRGRSLLRWTIDTVLEGNRFDLVVVSSDADEILADAATAQGVNVRRRPAQLASDAATTMDVLLDLLTSPSAHPTASGQDDGVLEALAGDPSTVVGLFQPTCPFRSDDDIRNTLALLEPGIDSAISVCPVEPPSELTFGISAAGHCEIPVMSPLIAGRTQRQNYEPSYAPNGCVYASSISHLTRTRSFFAGVVAAHIMPRERSLDIDDAFDWAIARALAQ